jgi:hypothetical protein
MPKPETHMLSQTRRATGGRTKSVLKPAAFGLVLIAGAAGALGFWLHAADRRQAQQVWEALEAAADSNPPPYDPQMVADLPEIARRYFEHAIEPGTPLHRVVRLEMEGTFVLNGNSMPMRARQILAPPAEGFVWQAEVGAGLMRFAGSDSHHAPAGGPVDSWTKFWLRGLVPLARIGTSPDHARAAATRTMLEAVWAPASLLPQFGVHWTQTGANGAEIRFDAAPDIEPMQMTLDAEGNPTEVVAQRWTDANPERVYRRQPFGGRMLETGRFAGFTIPRRVELGNLYGTSDYVPFFLGTITSAEFGGPSR